MSLKTERKQSEKTKMPKEDWAVGSTMLQFKPNKQAEQQDTILQNCTLLLKFFFTELKYPFDSYS